MSDLDYVVVGVTHDNWEEGGKELHFHTYYKWSGVPIGYEIHKVFYKNEGEVHLHLGFYVKQPEPLPTLIETMDAWVEKFGTPHMNSTKQWKDIYNAYLREKECCQ